MTFILLLFPRESLPALAVLYHDFLSAAQADLYSKLDMPDVRNSVALWKVLITRWDLTSLTHTLRVSDWRTAQIQAPRARPHG